MKLVSILQSISSFNKRRFTQTLHCQVRSCHCWCNGLPFWPSWRLEVSRSNSGTPAKMYCVMRRDHEHRSVTIANNHDTSDDKYALSEYVGLIPSRDNLISVMWSGHARGVSGRWGPCTMMTMTMTLHIAVPAYSRARPNDLFTLLQNAAKRPNQLRTQWTTEHLHLCEPEPT